MQQLIHHRGCLSKHLLNTSHSPEPIRHKPVLGTYKPSFHVSTRLCYANSRRFNANTSKLNTRHSRCVVRALEEGSSNVTVESAVDTIKACLKGIQQKELDALMDFVPDEVIDALLEQCKQSGTTDNCQLSFRAVLDMSSKSPAFTVDTYAIRTLFMSPPANVRVLSSLLVAPDRFVQRCSVSSTTGEECIITFVLRSQETLMPQYRGVNMQNKWMLMSITGETAHDELLDEPSPAYGPESVVLAQLEALRMNDIPRAYSFASPENKASVGGLHRFTRMLYNPVYSQLINHTKAVSLKRMHAADGTYIELLAITPQSEDGRKKDPCIYAWGVRRQPNSSRLAHCWMTDSVQLLRQGGSSV